MTATSTKPFATSASVPPVWMSTEIPGCASVNSRMKGTSFLVAKPGADESLTRPVSARLSLTSASIRPSCALSIVSMRFRAACPASVSFIGRMLRRMSSQPSAFSSPPIAREMLETSTSSALAAALSVPLRATVTKTRHAERSSVLLMMNSGNPDDAHSDHSRASSLSDTTLCV